MIRNDPSVGAGQRGGRRAIANQRRVGAGRREYSPKMTRWLRLCLSLALLASIPSSADTAMAQTASAAARALFGEARQLMQQGRFEEACPKLAESLRLDHGMGTQFNLAHCWENLGRTASAWALFLDVAAAARAADQTEREVVARQRAEYLESRLTRLTVSLTNPVPGTTVTRGGLPIRAAAWGTPVPVDPGDHQIVAKAPGGQVWSRTIRVSSHARTFMVRVPQLLPDSTNQQPLMQRDAGAHPPGVATLVMGGVGVAALAAGTVFYFRFRSHNDEAKGLCRTLNGDGLETCASADEFAQWQAAVDRAEDSRLFSGVSFGVGAASLITAGILYFTSDAKAPRARLQLGPVTGKGRWGLSLSGEF